MYLQYHSLYAGVIVLVLLSLLPLPIPFGVMIIVATCLGTEYYQIGDRFKEKREPWLYALTSLLQGIGLASLYAGIRFLMSRGGS